MAISFLSTLPRALRLAWSLVVKGVSDALTTRQMQSVLTKQKLGVRRQTLLDAMRLIKNGFVKDKTIRLLGAKVRPPLKMIPKALTKIRRGFSYSVRIEGVIEGRFESRIVTLATDDYLNREEAEARVRDKMENDYWRYGAQMEVASSSLVGIRRKGPLGTQ